MNNFDVSGILRRLVRARKPSGSGLPHVTPEEGVALTGSTLETRAPAPHGLVPYRLIYEMPPYARDAAVRRQLTTYLLEIYSRHWAVLARRP